MGVIRSCLLSLCFVPFTLWNIRWYWHCIAWLTFSQKFVIVGDNVPKKHPFFWSAQIEFDTFHFCGKLPKLWAGEGVGFGQCPKEMFFSGTSPFNWKWKKGWSSHCVKVEIYMKGLLQLTACGEPEEAILGGFKTFPSHFLRRPRFLDLLI